MKTHLSRLETCGLRLVSCLCLFGLSVVAVARPVEDAYAEVRYSARRGVIVVPGPSYAYHSEVHRVRTRRGEAVVTVEQDQFPMYPNVEVRPEGYALSIRAPKGVPVEIRLRKAPVDTLIVDGRRIGFTYNTRPTTYTFRLAGGQHFIRIAWPPANE